jgi:2-iminobutanoate/2-iminopropanoate deaminase
MTLMTARILRPESAAGRPYVPGLVVRDGLIFVSGQIPLRDGRLVDESIEAQVEVVLESIASILDDAGASLGDVVRCGLYLADLADLPRVNAVYERVFGDHLPTRTTVGVMLPGYGVDIDCIAVLSSA